MKLVREYLQLSKDDPPYPPINNSSALLMGSGWNTHRYFRGVYRSTPPNPGLIIMRGSEGLDYLGSRSLASTASEVFRGYLRDPISLRNRNRHLRPLAARTQALYGRSTYKALERLPQRELLRVAADSLRTIWTYNAYAFYSLAFDKHTCWEDLQDHGSSISSSELDTIWERGTIPTTPSFDRVQRRSVLRTLARGFDWDRIAEACQYFSASYYGVEQVADVRRRLRREFARFRTVKAASAELRRDLGDERRSHRAYLRWRSSLPLLHRRLVDYFQTVITVRDSRKNVFFQGLTVLWRAAERLFREAGIDADLLPYCSWEELRRGVGHLRTLRDELPQRRRGFAMLVRADGTVAMERGPYGLWKRTLDTAYLASIQHHGTNGKLHGQVGSPGIARGRVRIVLNLRQQVQFSKGDILVAGMTRPEYVPLMKRAGAIVTDEGGITCHAAIVSRELGIPCVIGTKVATRVLRDGDRVEVDAIHGVVRRLGKPQRT
jgi:phosphohistidine swiveling domain-containing protein